MAVLVFADSNDGKLVKSSYEAVFYGSKVAEKMGTNTVVVSFGNIPNGDLTELGKYGADKVLIDNNIVNVDSRQLTNLVVAAAKEYDAEVIIFSQDPTGRTVAPRVSVKLEAGYGWRVYC